MILDGKELSKKRKSELKQEVLRLKDIYNKVPKLAIIMVGNNPASQIYVRNKIKACAFCNIESELIHLEETVTMEELLNIIDKLNTDESVNGIIAQLPLPSHLNEQIVIDSISPNKDVDGFSLVNKGKLFCGIPSFTPATPQGIMTMLEEYNIDPKGKSAVVIGRSNIVGKPMAQLLLNKHATVTICHSRTTNLSEVAKQADILVVAIGKANFVTKDMVKPGATVIDVGINRIDDKLYGDVDFEQVKDIVGYISPVPGGVGPMTITTLLEHTVKAFKLQNE